MRIIFVGTGGGRFATTKQLRGYYTGGFYFEDVDKVYVDPGPSALFLSRKLKIPLERLDIIVLTHFHPDHISDAPSLIEAMTAGTLRRRGCVLSDETADKVLSEYHKKLPKRYGVKKVNETDGRFFFTPTIHAGGFGFIYFGRKTLGYTSDTIIFPELAEYFDKVDVLVANVVADRRHPWHMDIYSAGEFFSTLRVRQIIANHLGYGVIRMGEAAKKILDRLSGKDIRMARSGDVLIL